VQAQSSEGSGVSALHQRRACASEAVELGALRQGREQGREALLCEAEEVALALESCELAEQGKRDYLAA